jgi:hypothetical protein
MRQATLVCTLIAVLFFSVQSLAQVTTKNQLAETADTTDYQTKYLKKKRNAKGMIIGGSLGLVTGAVLVAASLPNTIGLYYTGNEDDSNDGTIAATAGIVLVFGGAGLVALGLATNGEANYIRRKHLSVTTVVPAVHIVEATIPQTGIGLRWRLDR